VVKHRHNGLPHPSVVPQLDEHLERELRFFRRGHHLVQLDGSPRTKR
jgi:hypothetical protein